MADFNDIVYKALVTAVENTQPTPTFMNRFFPTIRVRNTQFVEFDSRLGRARVAQFISPSAVADGSEKLSFSRNPVKLPTISDVQSLNVEDISRVGFGNLETDNPEIMENLGRQASDIIVDQRRMVSSRIGLSLAMVNIVQVCGLTSMISMAITGTM